MRKDHPLEFKEKLVAKLLSSNGPSVVELSNETGLSKSVLYKWLKLFKNNSLNTAGKKMSKSRSKWSLEAKLDAVILTTNMSEQERGVFCRSKGIYSEDLIAWRKELINGANLEKFQEQRSELLKSKTEVKNLKKELTRKEKALAEASALLILKKKASLLWGDPEDD